MARHRILVQLHGGLGNQLFQAAAGLSLAQRTGGQILFDLSRFRGNNIRQFALDGLPHGAGLFEGGRRTGLAKLAAKARNALAGQKVLPPRGWRGAVYEEAGSAFDLRFEQLAGEVLLAGYFQDLRYFAAVADVVRQGFDMRAVASPQAQALAAQLDGPNSIALHIRRGDYAANAAVAQAHGVLPDSYYEQALQQVRQAHPQSVLFVFSDDTTVADQKAALWDGTAMRGQSARDDLWLMSQCHHSIIANSTFSWWAAWLKKQPAGVTIAPARWFADERLNESLAQSLFPAEWMSL